MIRKVMAIATAAVAATLIALFSNHTPQAQETIQASAPLSAARPLMPGDILPAENVDFIEMPRPAMMLVPWPVVDAWAMCCTGLYCVPV